MRIASHSFLYEMTGDTLTDSDTNKQTNKQTKRAV